MAIPVEHLIERKARVPYLCAGDGSAHPKHAEGCTGRIGALERYIEYIGETPPYQSGSRHCRRCAMEFYGWGQ